MNCEKWLPEGPTCGACGREFVSLDDALTTDCPVTGGAHHLVDPEPEPDGLKSPGGDPLSYGIVASGRVHDGEPDRFVDPGGNIWPCWRAGTTWNGFDNVFVSVSTRDAIASTLEGDERSDLLAVEPSSNGRVYIGGGMCCASLIGDEPDRCPTCRSVLVDGDCSNAACDDVTDDEFDAMLNASRYGDDHEPDPAPDVLTGRNVAGDARLLADLKAIADAARYGR